MLNWAVKSFMPDDLSDVNLDHIKTATIEFGKT